MIQLLAIHPSRVWSQETLYDTHLRAYCARFPEAGFRDLQEQAHSEQIQLWIVWDSERAASCAIVGTELKVGADKQTTCNILFCAGRAARHWTQLISDIEAWAKTQGAYRVRFMGRPGWERLIAGYRRTHTVLEKVIA